MSVSPDQYTPERTWWWDGYIWQPTLSPDGQSRWSGTEWVPANSVFPPINVGLDEAPFCSGAPDATGLPPSPVEKSFDFAVGQGWMAGRAVVHWQVLQLIELATIAVVAPSVPNQLLHAGKSPAALPFVHFVDRGGKGLQIEANRISQAAATCIFDQTYRLGVLTPAAAAFLVGLLPADAWHFPGFHTRGSAPL